MNWNESYKDLYGHTNRSAHQSVHLLAVIFCLCWLLSTPATARSAEITPFHTFNQSPLVQIFGLPAAEDAFLQPADRTWTFLGTDIANNFAGNTASHEELLIDGESYRITMAFRHGISDNIEVGMDIPFVGHGAGVFDHFIEEWHDFFGLPEGGRKEAPTNRLLYTYSRDGQERLRLDDSNFGLGDIRLIGGLQLYKDRQTCQRAVALRASIKLPTGSISKLHGSGSTDVALWLDASDDYRLSGRWGHMTLFGSAGGMALTNGDVLSDQQRNFAGFGCLGFGWSPLEWLAFKSEISAHSPFYRGSDLPELTDPSCLLTIGGTLAFSPDTALDIGVSEDLVVSTAPDVALHLGLSHRF
ncbi:MAG: hypothetical protein CXR31_01170 [Geobacter sp.]|nr:MAG: hypothetical protein CXR31_01170 [Geobacter sp.]